MPHRGAEAGPGRNPFPTPLLAAVVEEFGTPSFVYSVPAVDARVRELRATFVDCAFSFAMKSNPNAELLVRMETLVEGLDVSSGGELALALERGWPAERVRFTGPTKRTEDLALAVDQGVGAVVLESLEEARELSELARTRGRVQSVLVRIDPAHAPRGFGVQLGGKPSRFGIDEDELEEALDEIRRLEGVRTSGLHVFVGTQCLNEDSLVQHLEDCAARFLRFGERLEAPETFVFGAGFGIPYADKDEPLDLRRLAKRAQPALHALKARFPQARQVLEMGRFLVGEAGLYLTRVQRVKASRGSELALIDGGMHHHAAACGLLGGVLHRNYPMFVVGREDASPEEHRRYDLVGPLCTAIDTLARRAALPPLAAGDVVAVRSSGAYGPSASPGRFLGHPAAREVLLEEGERGLRARDVTPGPEEA